jgi:hypothetical protein
MTIVDAQWIENWNREYQRKQDELNPGRVAKRLAAADAATDRRLEDRRIANTEGSFGFHKVWNKAGTECWCALRYKKGGKIVATFPHADAGKMLNKQLGKLLGSAHYDALSMSTDSTLPKDPEGKHRFLLLYKKALEFVVRSPKTDSKRASQCAKALIRLVAVFDSIDYSTAQQKNAVKEYHKEVEDQQLVKKAKRFKVSDLFQEAALQSLCEEGIQANLQDKGLELNPENIEAEHALICEELERGVVSEYGKAEAKRIGAAQARQVFPEVSLTCDEEEDSNASFILQEASLDRPAVIGERGIVLNDVCTPEQHIEEERHDCNYTDRTQMLAALNQLNEYDRAFLEEYENATKTYPKGDRDRAYRLKNKIKRFYQEMQN